MILSIQKFCLLFIDDFIATQQLTFVRQKSLNILLRTPGPVPFGTCIYSNVETIFSWSCHVLNLIYLKTGLNIWKFRFLLKNFIFPKFKTCWIFEILVKN